MSEYNRNPKESKDAEEYKRDALEFHAAEERKYYFDNSQTPENNPSSARKRANGGGQRQNKVSTLSRLISGFVAVTAVVVVAVSVGIIETSGSSAEIVKASASDTTVTYEVSVEEGDDLNVVLYNDFTRRENALAYGTNTGEFDDLKPGMSYTIAVVEQSAFGERTVTKMSVKTDLLPPPKPVSVWNGITHECTCSVDGYFHFTMDFEDENGYFTDFEASLTDDFGNISHCEFSEDLHGDQRIDVTLKAGLKGSSATFALKFKNADPDAETSEYSYEVKVKI